MRRNFVLSILVLGAAACVVHADGDGCSYDDDYVCYLEYTPGYGYERVCEWTVDPLVCVDLGADADGRPARYSSRPSSSSSGASSSSTDSTSQPSGPPPRSSAPDVGTDIPCSRDGQCGTGLCIEGECFYGCLSDVDCGTGDVCSVVSSMTVCQAAAEPTVECTRTAECGNAQLCLNAVCHDSCETTEDCGNPLDRCDGSICVPDRSVVSECLLDRECALGEVCIDASCRAR
jgi:Dickkopf N-terminal cysteine-rich region